MLFPYALLFFLFTTFAAAAPTMMLQKRGPDEFTTNKNRDFLMAKGGVWTRVESVSRLYLIFWLFLTYMTGADGNIDIFYSHLHYLTLRSMIRG